MDLLALDLLGELVKSRHSELSEQRVLPVFEPWADGKLHSAPIARKGN